MKKLLSIGLISIMVFCISGCTETSLQEAQENNGTNSIETNYLTSLEWTNSGYEYSDAQEEWLKVAIEIDSYDGDILAAGTYTVTQTAGEYDGTAQRVYNLYITSLDTENHNDIQNDTFPYSIGNHNGSDTEITLEKGQYLYIQKVSGGEIGHLFMELS